MIDYPKDQQKEAWDKVLRQHVNKPQTEGFFKSFFGPMSDIVQVAQDLRFKRGLETAQGKQLDGIGEIVGVGRSIPQSVYLSFFGYSSQDAGRGYGQARYRQENEIWATAYELPDTEYRALIKAKIALNNGHGTTEEIISAVQNIFGVERVIVRRLGVAHIQISIGRIPDVNGSVLDYFEKFIPVSAGIGYDVLYFNPGAFFGYDNQIGAVGYQLTPYAIPLG